MELENNTLLISVDALLDERMLTIKGKQVLLDADVAKLLDISLPVLRRKVRENKDFFPKEFMFGLKPEELKKGYLIEFKGRKKISAFTWGGIMMAATRVNSKRAIDLHVQLVRHYGGKIGIFNLLQKL